ncbi:MAG: GyrI-like domain-containing protein [Flavobacteriaceae bacterium]|nr:GyrI-like domain-containing protein [Flavobacteriaceae bacterium]
MLPRIEHIKEKKFIGKRLNMSLANNKTKQLWKSFMPFRNEIKNSVNSEFVSLQVYDEEFKISDLNHEFEKWALVEVTSFDVVPKAMKIFVLKPGLYVVFHYKGLNTDSGVFKYIFNVWLPNSGYLLDNRPHFEVLGKKYKNGDPNSEEDIWIPIKEKK